MCSPSEPGSDVPGGTPGRGAAGPGGEAAGAGLPGAPDTEPEEEEQGGPAR